MPQLKPYGTRGLTRRKYPDGGFLRASRNPSVPEVDLRVGGNFKYHMKPAEGDAFYAHGVFKEIIPNELIKSTWQWSNGDQETLLTVKFNEVEDGTQLTVIHELFQDEEQKNMHADGWNSCMSRIERIL